MAPELRINDQIRVPSVRLIGAKGEQLGVVPTQRALLLAQDQGFDLVEIAPTAVPPVAKLLDFGKYRFEEQQKQKEAKKKQRAVIWKEIRMAPQIDDHDIETKVKAAAKFLGEGDKLKLVVRFRGRQLVHPDRGRALLLRVSDSLKEHGVVERMPFLEGRQMFMVMNPLRREGAPTPQPARPAVAAQPTPIAAAAPAPKPAPPPAAAAQRRPVSPMPTAPRAASPARPAAAPRPR